MAPFSSIYSVLTLAVKVHIWQFSSYKTGAVLRHQLQLSNSGLNLLRLQFYYIYYNITLLVALSSFNWLINVSHLWTTKLSKQIIFSEHSNGDRVLGTIDPLTVYEKFNCDYGQPEFLSARESSYFNWISFLIKPSSLQIV